MFLFRWVLSTPQELNRIKIRREKMDGFMSISLKEKQKSGAFVVVTDAIKRKNPAFRNRILNAC
jgi:hypothetical protein